MVIFENLSRIIASFWACFFDVLARLIIERLVGLFYTLVCLWARLRSPANRQRNQRPGCAVEAVEPAAGIDQLGKLRIADAGALADGPDAARLFLEVPDEFAAGAFLHDPPAVLGEDRDARPKQGAPHHWED